MDATAEAASRNEYLRRKYGRLRAHMMWRPSDINVDTVHEWWEDVLCENHNNAAADNHNDVADNRNDAADGNVRPETHDTLDTSACAETTRQCTVCEICESTPTPGTPDVF
jgi:hypothetical protein